MWFNPISWNWFRRAECPAEESQHPVLEDLLFRLEFSECEREQEELRKELDALVAHDAEAARIYEMHELLERELQALFAGGAKWVDVKPPSPMRRLMIRVRSFFSPGPVG